MTSSLGDWKPDSWGWEFCVFWAFVQIPELGNVPESKAYLGTPVGVTKVIFVLLLSMVFELFRRCIVMSVSQKRGSS